VAPPNKAAGVPDTIFALSSGAPPAAIAVVRISGPEAGATLDLLAGKRPPPRRASFGALRTGAGDILDHALILWLPGPATATGEDLVELHLHGGRAVVAAVLKHLGTSGLRPAEPGEFTRRALLNGRLDLSEVEGLADLLAAETEAQRREAITRSSGMLARRLDHWGRTLIIIAARIEAVIDYDGEMEDLAPVAPDIAALLSEIGHALDNPPAERLRDGLRVVISGPPNAGKSSLFNAILGTDAAIVSPIEGTTRDALERFIAIDGLPFLLIDTAGDRDAVDPIERIGVDRARQARADADIILDLVAAESRDGVIAVAAKSDLGGVRPSAQPVSAASGEGISALLGAIANLGRTMLPREGEMALDRKYRDGLWAIRTELQRALVEEDSLLVAEHIRLAREGLDRLTGRAGIDDMLDALFGRFCLGK
jgi:tRNA modification GTPase